MLGNQILEHAQWRVTMLVKDLEHKSYEEGLRSPSCLVWRRLKEDVPVLYSSLKGGCGGVEVGFS